MRAPTLIDNSSKTKTVVRVFSRLFNRHRPVFSIVTAAYNVAPYIDAFCHSVIEQSYDLSRIEVIIVDDGSTDDTRERALEWSHRYPRLIHVVHQPNGGVARARNAGMDRAKGEWISFPDPDDILHPDYLTQCVAAIRQAGPTEGQIAVVANLIRYLEAEDRISDTHAMRYRFTKGIVQCRAIKTREMIVQSVSHALFRRAPIVEHKLRFDPRIGPTFEDGQFANALLILEAEKLISFVPEAIYYYRKRAQKNSAVDQSRNDLRWFTTQIDMGYLSLIRLARATLGYVPPFVQINCLYSMMWRFRYLLDAPDHAAQLGPHDRATLIRHLEAVFSEIDPDTIQRFNRAGCTELHKVALLSRYTEQHRVPLRIQPQDLGDGLFEFKWHLGPDDLVCLIPQINGHPVVPVSTNQCQRIFLDQPYATTTTMQLRVTAGDTTSFSADDGRAICLRDRGTDMGSRASYNQLTQLKPTPIKTG